MPVPCRRPDVANATPPQFNSEFTGTRPRCSNRCRIRLPTPIPPPFNQRNVWRRITEQAPELVVIAAASERPKLYGGYARRALDRNGAYAEVLPVALDAAEFEIDHRNATSDSALAEMVHEADGVFFVGGAPQRLASVLIHADGSPTPLGNAVADAHASGGVVVGGIAGSVALSTGVDAFEALASGRVPSTALHRGLGLIDGDWFIDQHAFSAGRLAEILVAMRQLGATRGLGIGANTAAVVRAGRVEVIGDEGMLVIDLSGTGSGTGFRDGFRLAGARISYSGERRSSRHVLAGGHAVCRQGGRIRDRARFARHASVRGGTPGRRRSLRAWRAPAIAARGARRSAPRGIRCRVSRGRGG